MYILLRIITTLLLLMGMVLIPWWLWIVCVIAMGFLWGSYYEMIFLGFLYDVLTADPSWRMWFPFAIFLTAVFMVIEVAKTRLIMYRA